MGIPMSVPSPLLSAGVAVGKGFSPKRRHREAVDAAHSAAVALRVAATDSDFTTALDAGAAAVRRATDITCKKWKLSLLEQLKAALTAAWSALKSAKSTMDAKAVEVAAAEAAQPPNPTLIEQLAAQYATLVTAHMDAHADYLGLVTKVIDLAQSTTPAYPGATFL